MIKSLSKKNKIIIDFQKIHKFYTYIIFNHDIYQKNTIIEEL